MSKSVAEKQVIFAMGEDNNGIPFVILGVTKQAWDYMKDGKSHNFDLTKGGLPLRLVMFGGKDHSTVMAEIDKIMAAHNMPYLDQRGKDFSIDGKKDE